MSIALIDHVGSAGAPNGSDTSSNARTTDSSAKLITVHVAYDGASNFTQIPFDSKSNIYTSRNRQRTNDNVSEIYDCASPTTGSGHTFGISAAGSYSSLQAAWWSGVDTTPFDVANGSTNNGSTVPTGSITPGAPGELVVTGMATDGGSSYSATSTSGNTFVVTDSNGFASATCYGAALAYTIQTGGSPAAESVTWSGGSFLSAATIAAYKAASASGSTITAAAGVATTSTLTGSSTAASTPTAAAGVATDSTLTGKSTAAATLTAAAGVATDSTVTGSSVAAATITAAAGVATTSTLSSGSASGITAAAGVATASTLTGSSVAASTVTAAAGVATSSTLTGSVGAPIITPAAGVATGGTLAGSSVAVASIVAAAGVATAATVSTIPPAGSTGAVIMLPIRLISGVYTTTGVVASRALQNLKAALPNRSVPAWQQDGTMTPQWYRYHQMFVDVFIGSAAAYTLDDIVNSVVTSQANATQQALTTSAIAQQLQGVAEATAVVKQVAVSNSLSGADQIPDVPLSRGMEP